MTRRPRNSVNDRPSKWKLILRRQRRLARPAAWVAFTALVAGLVFVIARTAAPDSSVVSIRERLGGFTGFTGLRVTDVVVEGRANTPEPLLRAAIGVNRGEPILGFSVEQARKRIESLTWVEQATVERRLPGTVVVFLQERRPFAIWQNHGKYMLNDRAGLTVDNQDGAQCKHLPWVVGPGAPAAAAEMLDAIAERPALSGRIVALVRVGERRWNLHMKNGTDVMLPEGHEPAALDRLVRLQQDQAILDRPLAVIDLRLPDRLVVRPRSETKGETAASSGPLPVPPSVPVASKKPL